VCGQTKEKFVHRILITPALIGIGLLAAACGSASTSDQTTPATPAPAAASTPAPAAASTPAPAAATPVAATPAAQTLAVQIRHQQAGCHAWAFNGGAFKPSQKIHVPVGTTLKVVDGDIMPHTLMQTGGPSVAITGAEMKKMMSASTVTFAKPGVYRFKTEAGEDYPNMAMDMETTGEDNVLTMRVVVS
jgi:plastocyanin